jgi:hypothetical protein
MMNTNRIRDLLVHILIALFIVGVIVAWGFYVPRESDLPAKWVNFGINTFALFAFPIVWMTSGRRTGRFWMLWLGLLTGHVAIYIVLLVNVTRWPLLFYLIAAPFEFMLMIRVLSFKELVSVIKPDGAKHQT